MGKLEKRLISFGTVGEMKELRRTPKGIIISTLDFFDIFRRNRDIGAHPGSLRPGQRGTIAPRAKNFDASTASQHCRGMFIILRSCWLPVAALSLRKDVLSFDRWPCPGHAKPLVTSEPSHEKCPRHLNWLCQGWVRLGEGASEPNGSVRSLQMHCLSVWIGNSSMAMINCRH